MCEVVAGRVVVCVGIDVVLAGVVKSEEVVFESGGEGEFFVVEGGRVCDEGVEESGKGS